MVGDRWGRLVTFSPVMGKELGVNRLGTSLLEVDEVVVGGWVGVVDFQSSPGFNMTGFYGDLGWRHQTGIKVQDGRFWWFWR